MLIKARENVRPQIQVYRDSMNGGKFLTNVALVRNSARFAHAHQGVNFEIPCAINHAKVFGMAASAPTPPEKTLHRVATLSCLNGWSVVVVAGLGALVALAP